MKFTSSITVFLILLSGSYAKAQGKHPAENFPFTGKIELFEGYPNPVEQGGMLTVPYKAIHAESVTITLYSATGQRLLTFSNLKEAGSLSIETSQLTPGVYTYALVVNGRLTDKKRVLVR